MNKNFENMYICVSGLAGNIGTKIIIEEKYNELVLHYSHIYINRIIKETDTSLKQKFEINDVIDIQEVNRGGVLSAIWNICERNNIGIDFYIKKIPINYGTIEIANYFDFTPYRLLSENCFVYITKYQNVKKNIYTNVIGQIKNQRKRVAINEDYETFLTKQSRDEIDLIIPKYIKRHLLNGNNIK